MLLLLCTTLEWKKLEDSTLHKTGNTRKSEHPEDDGFCTVISRKGQVMLISRFYSYSDSSSLAPSISSHEFHTAVVLLKVSQNMCLRAKDLQGDLADTGTLRFNRAIRKSHQKPSACPALAIPMSV